MKINLDSLKVGDNEPVFIIAEAGVNHMGSQDIAIKLIEEAKLSGADCVKFQTFKADRIVSKSAPKANYQNHTTDPDESQYDMLKALEIDENIYGDLINSCNDNNILFMSTPYNEEDIDFLDDLNVQIFKAASIHIAEPRFLKHMANKGKPMIISTGMATLDEIDIAIKTILDAGNDNFVVMQCTSNYPSLIEECNLKAMLEMKSKYECLVGYSDHTQTNISAITAVALGACVIEKHFTLDKTLPGPDQSTSESPEGFKVLVNQIREAEIALGDKEKSPTVSEKKNIFAMRRSIVANKDIKKGEEIKSSDLTFKRPVIGITPVEIEDVVGTYAIDDISKDEFLSWNKLKK